MSAVDRSADVVVVGAGVAGLTASTLLAREGLDVLCVDPEPPPRDRVGESLDWSAPGLLQRIGLSADTLVRDGVGTWKREVRGVTTMGERVVYRPVGGSGGGQSDCRCPRSMSTAPDSTTPSTKPRVPQVCSSSGKECRLWRSMETRSQRAGLDQGVD